MQKGIDKLLLVCYLICVRYLDEIVLQRGEVLSVKDAANEIGAHFTTLYRQVKKGKIVFVTFGNTIFIPFLEVERIKRENNKKAAVLPAA